LTLHQLFVAGQRRGVAGAAGCLLPIG